MPRGDRTGSRGMGPMTGRGAGFCAGYSVPGCANPVPRRGRGMGCGGWGHGRRHWFHATGLPGWFRTEYAPAPESEVESLKAQAGWLTEQLEAIQRRIAELEKQE